ncbi:MAG TPA: OmpH family outer membrane protein [Thermodesulfovibrionales bacterium]|nr:OmpH family outer membrane protein [Thermodesulfovibrionales bacterium]
MGKITEKKRHSVLWVGFVVFLVTLGLVKASSATDGVKIGYVDLRVALNESESGKKAKTELETLIKTKQAAIEEKGKNVEKLKAELEKQGSVLSAEAKKAKEEEIERLLRDYQRMVQDAQAEIKKKEDQITGGIIKEIREVIDKIGQEDGYSLILENVEGIILYSRKDLDVTDKVIKRYNETRTKDKK